MCVAEDLPSEIVSLSVIPTQEEAPVIAVRAVRVKTRPTWWKDYVVETKVNYRWIVNHHWSLALFFCLFRVRQLFESVARFSQFQRLRYPFFVWAPRSTLVFGPRRVTNAIYCVRRVYYDPSRRRQVAKNHMVLPTFQIPTTPSLSVYWQPSSCLVKYSFVAAWTLSSSLI